MLLQYYGHSAFLLHSAEGVRVCTDPYRSGDYEGALGYAPIEDEFDVVVMTHTHADHSAVDALAGEPLQVRAACRVRGLEINVLPTFHDDCQGALRGPNQVVVLQMDGLRIVHCGDLGHDLDDHQVSALAGCEVLLVPVGGTYTLDATAASRLVDRVRPRVAVPMHYKTPAIGFPLDDVGHFLRLRSPVRTIRSGCLELTADCLPPATTVLHLLPTHAGHESELKSPHETQPGGS